MINTFTRFIILTSLITITACGGGGGDTGGGDTGGDGTALSLANAFGGTIETNTAQLPSSISTVCYEDNEVSPADGIKDTLTISGTTVTYSSSKYTADTTCSNTPTTTSFTADLTVDQDVIIVDWIDGQNQSTPAPAKASDSGTLLSATAPYTRINITITESNFPGVTVGMQSNQGYVIDDSSSDGVILYRVDENGNATVVDPFTTIPASSTPPPSSGGPNLVVTITSVDYTAPNLIPIINYTVTNTGDQATATTAVIMGWINRVEAPDYSSAQSGQFETVPVLAVGESTNGSITISSQTVETGNLQNVYAIVDFFEEIAETDEGVTGTNDNLAHKTWIASDVFNLQGTNYVDGDQSTTITARFESGATYLTFNNGLNGADKRAMQIRFLGEILNPGTYSISSAEIIAVQVLWASETLVTHSVVTSATPFSVVISSAGNVITGTYSGTLCPTTALTSSGCQSNGNFSGNFSISRDAN